MQRIGFILHADNVPVGNGEKVKALSPLFF